MSLRAAISRPWAALPLLTALLLAGCSQPAAPPVVKPLRVDAEAAFVLLKEQVAIGPRASNTAGAEKTANWIAARCREMGYEPLIDTWEEQTDNGVMTFRNVLASLPGQGDRFILLGSHYDTKYLPAVPDFQGANDSASSTALLLEIMRVLKANEPWHALPLRFAFFDGEESLRQYTDGDGLHGSRRLAAAYSRSGDAARCRAMVLLDMVGDAELTITLSHDNDPLLIRTLLQIAERQGTRDHFSFHRRGNILDDHVPFQKLDIPVINLIDFNYGPSNGYWHTANDNLDHVSPDSLAIVGNAVLELIQQLQPRPKGN